MTDESAMLRAVLADPGDDAPRLYFADWLDEHGQPERGEFIRVQCRLAAYESGMKCLYEMTQPGRPTHSPNCPCRALRRREGELLETLGSNPFAWFPGGVSTVGLQDGGSGNPPHGRLRRGFVEELTCDWPAWRDHADKILAAQPVRRVTLTTRPAFSGGPRHSWGGPYHGSFGDRELVVVPEGEAIAEFLLSHYWPGVEFTLPPEDPWGHVMVREGRAVSPDSP